MAVPEAVTDFVCPGCMAVLQPQEDRAKTLCPSCGWTGTVYLFRPVDVEPEKASDALPDDAKCVHHASKRAVAACAGTGDFICALCAIDLDGETYSAQHLNSGGKKKVSTSFDRYFARPDREIGLVIFLGFIMPCLFFITIPYGIYRYFKMLRLRQDNDLYRQVVGPIQVAVWGVLLGVITLFNFSVCAAFFFAEMD